MGFLELFGQINWIISLLVAILLSIIANLFTPSISNWLAKLSESRSSARVEELKSDLEEISKYANSPSKLSLLISHTIIQVLIFFSLASAIASLGTAMPFVLWSISVETDALEYISPLYLLSSSLLYLMGVMSAMKVSRIISKIRKFDTYKLQMEKIITSLEKSAPR